MKGLPGRGVNGKRNQALADLANLGDAAQLEAALLLRGVQPGTDLAVASQTLLARAGHVPGAFEIVGKGTSFYISIDGRLHNTIAELTAHQKLLRLYAPNKYAPVYHTTTYGKGATAEQVTRKVYRNTTDFDGGVPQYISRNDVDQTVLSLLDSGHTNKMLMAEGYAPIGRDGLQVNLHHVIGAEPGPMVELLQSVHQRYYSPLHGLIESGTSFRNNPTLNYRYETFREAYWKFRSNDFS